MGQAYWWAAASNAGIEEKLDEGKDSYLNL